LIAATATRCMTGSIVVQMSSGAEDSSISMSSWGKTQSVK